MCICFLIKNFNKIILWLSKSSDLQNRSHTGGKKPGLMVVGSNNSYNVAFLINVQRKVLFSKELHYNMIILPNNERYVATINVLVAMRVSNTCLPELKMHLGIHILKHVEKYLQTMQSNIRRTVTFIFLKLQYCFYKWEHILCFTP